MENLTITLINSDISVWYNYEKGNDNSMDYNQPPDPDIFELGDIFWNGYKITDFLLKIVEETDRIYEEFSKREQHYYYQNEDITDLVRDVIEFNDFYQHIETLIYQQLD